MEAFQWSACFVTGVPEVDTQHRRLVDLINQFGHLVLGLEGASATELETVFRELADYAEYHFAEEEALMTTMRLAPAYIEQHRHGHRSFIDEVTQMHGSIGMSDGTAARKLLQFLTHWLAYHILGTDQGMARQMAAIAAGCTPEEARLTKLPSNDAATEALLSALNGLFHQVSERNLELIQLNRTLEMRVEERTRALSVANRLLEEVANTDTLTGLPNRRYAMRRFSREWFPGTGDGAPLSCLLIDADGFKSINDSYGHAAGDTVLRALSMQLLHAVRNDDIVCRLGGDEFLVICARTPLEGAMQLAESIRREVGALRVPAGAGEWKGSISIGAATRSAEMNSVDDLLKQADQALYVAKRKGRNRAETIDFIAKIAHQDAPVMTMHIHTPNAIEHCSLAIAEAGM